MAGRAAPSGQPEQLQQLLDRYQAEFNQRPHQGLDDNQTPLERRIAKARPRPVNGPIPEPTIVRHCKGRIGGYLAGTATTSRSAESSPGRPCWSSPPATT